MPFFELAGVAETVVECLSGAYHAIRRGMEAYRRKTSKSSGIPDPPYKNGVTILHSSKFLVILGTEKRIVYADASCRRIGSVTKSVPPTSVRVTSGILRIYSPVD